MVCRLLLKVEPKQWAAAVYYFNFSLLICKLMCNLPQAICLPAANLSTRRCLRVINQQPQAAISLLILNLPAAGITYTGAQPLLRSRSRHILMPAAPQISYITGAQPLLLKPNRPLGLYY